MPSLLIATSRPDVLSCVILCAGAKAFRKAKKKERKRALPFTKSKSVSGCFLSYYAVGIDHELLRCALVEVLIALRAHRRARSRLHSRSLQWANDHAEWPASTAGYIAAPAPARCGSAATSTSPFRSVPSGCRAWSRHLAHPDRAPRTVRECPAPPATNTTSMSEFKTLAGAGSSADP